MFLVILGAFCFLLIKVFLNEAFPIKSYIYSLVLLSLLLLSIFSIIQYWRGIATKIITDSNGIRIKRPFKSIDLDWGEIFEFGRCKRMEAYVGRFWVYYLRGGKLGNKRIILATRGLKNLEDLVLYILFKAPNVKIV